FEFLTQLAVIIDLAVKGYRPASRGVGFRLGACRARVDDGEPPVAKHDALVRRCPERDPIRPAAALQLVEARHHVLTGPPQFVAEMESAGNPAHCATSLAIMDHDQKK